MEAGIDESGRGPVVGPMVVAIVAGDGRRLAALGVKDSKLLTPARRAALYRAILREAACVNYLVIEPHEIDRYVAAGRLNRLEAEAAVQLMATCPADVYYVDSPDPRPGRFGAALAAVGRRVVALHRGERIPQVAAASVVAKVVRDSLVALLRREVDFGSGYPSDPRTREALPRVPPECVRWTWKTARGLSGGRPDS